MDEKQKNDLATNTVQEAKILVQEDASLLEASKKLDEMAQLSAQQVRIMAQADGAMENAFRQKPFVPDPDQSELFDEINAEVQAMNDLDAGAKKAGEALREPSSKEGLQGVIDQAIEEARERQGEEALETDLVNGLEREDD